MTIELNELLVALAFGVSTGTIVLLWRQVRLLKKQNTRYALALDLSVKKLLDVAIKSGISPFDSNVPVLGCGCPACTKQREQEGADEGIAKA